MSIDPIIETTETLSKYGFAVYIYDPEDGYLPIFKIAPTWPGAVVFFEKEELKRFYPDKIEHGSNEVP